MNIANFPAHSSWVDVRRNKILVDVFGDLDIDILLVYQHSFEPRLLTVGTQLLPGQQDRLMPRNGSPATASVTEPWPGSVARTR